MPSAEVSERSRNGLTTDSLVVRGSGFLTAEVDDEIVALSIDKGTCYSLNQTGARVWNMIEAPTRIGDICKLLVEHYDIDRSTCETEVLDLLEELKAEGLIATPEES